MPADFPTDESIQLYRFAFEHAPDPTVVLDDEGRVVVRNEAARPLPDGVQGLLAADARELDLFHLELTKRGRARAEVEVAGRFLAIEGRVHGARRVLTFRDQSEPRRLEAQLRAMQRAESLGPLAATFAHDLNNLLTPICSLASCLENALPPGEREWRMARDVRVAAERASAMARQTLRLVRGDIIRAPAEPLSVNAVLADMRTLIERVVGDEVRVELALGTDAGAVKVDRAGLEGAVLDLAVNARDAMRAGGRLTMTTARVALDGPASSNDETCAGDYVCIRMTDTGSGMTPDVRARIFEPFFTTKDPGRGTGLGLPAVRRFVVESGGCIAVHSQPGNGTTMALYFPSAAVVSRAACTARASG